MAGVFASRGLSLRLEHELNSISTEEKEDARSDAHKPAYLRQSTRGHRRLSGGCCCGSGGRDSREPIQAKAVLAATPLRSKATELPVKELKRSHKGLEKRDRTGERKEREKEGKEKERRGYDRLIEQ